MALELHVLPRAGGLLDQDYHEFLLLRAGIRAIREKQRLDEKKKVK